MKTYKYFLYILIALLLLIANAYAQPAIVFEKEYGGAGTAELGAGIADHRDGGYYITGRFSGVTDVFTMKTDSLGEYEWQKFFPGPALFYQPYSMTTTPDSGYWILSNPNFIIRLDKNTDTLWTKAFYGNTSLWYKISHTSDNGCILSGRAHSMMKFSSSGDSIWAVRYPVTPGFHGDFYDVSETPDGGYLAVGYENSIPLLTTNGIIVKTNSDGDSLWAKTIPNTVFYGITLLQGGGLAVTGEYFDTTASFVKKLVVALMDDSGNMAAWHIVPTPGGDAVAWDLLQTPDGGLVVAGKADVQFPYFAKIDLVGNKLWEVIITDKIGGIRQFYHTADGGFAGTGDANSNLYIIKLGTDSTSLVGIDKEISNKISVYPNPTKDRLFVRMENEIPSFLQMEILDGLGKVVSTPDPNKSLRSGIDLSKVPPGIYLLSIKTETGILTKKILVER